jgi:hypothetical protein
MDSKAMSYNQGSEIPNFTDYSNQKHVLFEFIPQDA